MPLFISVGFMPSCPTLTPSFIHVFFFFCSTLGWLACMDALIFVAFPQQAGRVFDLFFPNDVCENAPGVYGFCNQARFPTCREGRELICYNRRPMRNTFYKDIRQPHFYIDYNSVFCYPTSWSGCSSCSPGRYCLSEQRCILDERDYPCERWI